MKITFTSKNTSDAVLFSLDNAPDTIPSPSEYAIPLNFSGNERIHIYVDEPLPAQTSLYLDQDSKQTGQLTTSTGHIGCGDIQALQRPDTKQLKRHATETDIPPGLYQLTWYNTDFPEELIEKTIHDQLGEKPKPSVKLPPWVMWGSAAAFIGLWFLKQRELALICAFVPFLGWRLLPHSKTYLAQEKAREQWKKQSEQLEDDTFPGLVILMERIGEPTAP